MRVERIPEMTLDEFAAREGLELIVMERRLPIGHPSRFYARFDRCETKGDGVLIGEYGDGATPEDAADEFRQMISLKTLVYSAYTDARREIVVPRLAAVPATTPEG